MEVWKDIEGYEGMYQVSNMGRVKSLDRFDAMGRRRKGQVLKPCCNGNGYKYVTLARDGKRPHAYIHRLVAKAFIENPANLPQINHKDERKSNNRASNLEWCDEKYNLNYGTVRQRIAESKRGKPMRNRRQVEAIEPDTGVVVRRYVNIYEAMADGHDISGISQVCKGDRKTYHGYTWRYRKAM